MKRSWALTAREVFTISGRHWVVVWGDPKGDEIRTGDGIEVRRCGRGILGVVEGIEFHRPVEAPASWVGIQVGGAAAEAVRAGSEIRGHGV